MIALLEPAGVKPGNCGFVNPLKVKLEWCRSYQPSTQIQIAIRSVNHLPEASMTFSVGPYLKLLVLSLFIILFFVSGYDFFVSFPHQYSWGEMLLNYQGGFTKRALIGQLAFRFRHLLDPQKLICLIVLATYLLLSYLFVITSNMTSRLSGILFLFSPTGWLWPLIVEPAFGRKDVFIILTSVVSLLIARAVRNAHCCFLLCIAVFAISGFVVETVWFYFPLVFLTVTYTSECRNKNVKLTYMIIGLLCGLVFLTTMAILPSPNLNKIHSSLPGVFPEPYDFTVLCCLNYTIRDALDISYASGRAFGGGYLLALVFGALPISMNLIERKCRGNFDVTLPACILMLSVSLFCFVPLLLAADWGRYIYLELTINFCCLWMSDPANVANDWKSAHLDLKLERILFVILYATTWQTVHYRDGGNSAFIPGVLFRMMGESDLPRNVD